MPPPWTTCRHSFRRGGGRGPHQLSGLGEVAGDLGQLHVQGLGRADEHVEGGLNVVPSDRIGRLPYPASRASNAAMLLTAGIA